MAESRIERNLLHVRLHVKFYILTGRGPPATRPYYGCFSAGFMRLSRVARAGYLARMPPSEICSNVIEWFLRACTPYSRIERESLSTLFEEQEKFAGYGPPATRPHSCCAGHPLPGHIRVVTSNYFALCKGLVPNRTGVPACSIIHATTQVDRMRTTRYQAVLRLFLDWVCAAELACLFNFQNPIYYDDPEHDRSIFLRIF
ncbi:hypothetical protein DFH08DRAFT_808116 [Mycena albidolilacea]|uniref:Uncharacterized protein n=1 Tax=Mycena albidolilacea TaxID=1033008 RepID=A0AAD7A2P7_9AGAR|nr:hypothetical protein DFH08DRAFT_808116 [Mycena albidolilacea]